MSKWIMEVKCFIAETGKKEWRAVKATHATTPYTYETKLEAQQMLESLYPDSVVEDLRVREITGGN